MSALYMGYMMGVSPVLSYFYGANNSSNLKKIRKISIRFISIISVITTVLSVVFSDILVNIFTNQHSEVYALAVDGNKLFSIALFVGFNTFASMLFTALSNGKISAIISFSRTFMEDTKTSALLICRGNKNLFEEYYLGSDESTNFSVNSVTKSITSALVGIAVQEGKIKSIDESIANYIDEFKGTELATVSIKDCLQMSSCINFDEERDMGKISFSSMFGKNKMKMIAKLGLYAPSGTDRRYSSINTDILGELISNATDETLTDYM